MLPKKFQDLRVFITHVWKKLGLPKPTPLQLKMADVIQNVLKAAGVIPLPVSPTFAKRYPMLVLPDGKITRRVILEAYRGIGKSWECSTAAVWCLGWNVALNIMALSAAKQKSDEFSGFALQLIRDIPELNFLTPDKM